MGLQAVKRVWTFVKNNHKRLSAMPRFFLSVAASLFLVAIVHFDAIGQCFNSNMYTPVIFPNNFNNPTTINCVTATQYVGLADIVTDRVYRVTSSTATDYLTVTTVTGGTVIAHGPSPLDFTPGGPQVLVHVNTNASCGQNGNCRTLTVQCQTCLNPPANNNCADALSVPVYSGTECPTQDWYNNHFSTADGPNNSCLSSGEQDVWFKFTATATTHLIRTEGYGTDIAQFNLFRNNGSCPGILIGSWNGTCSADPGMIYTGLTIGTEYRIRVGDYLSDYCSFALCVLSPPAAPSNDNCAGAVTLTPQVGPCTTPTIGTTLGATPTTAAGTNCGSSSSTFDDDVWYKFTATATVHTITVTPDAGVDIQFAVRDQNGTCGSQIIGGCSTGGGAGITEVVEASGLTIGATYRIRVWTPGFLVYGGFNICVTEAAMPVDLVAFTAKAAGKEDVLLQWETAQEINNDYFDIEHSTDGSRFQAIGREPAKSNAANQYTFLHRNATPGIHYYRLKQTDHDGAFQYSPVVNLSLSNDGIQVSPNPVTHRLYVRGENLGGASFTVWGQTGKTLVQGTFAEAGDTFDLDVSALPEGFYVLEIQYGTKIGVHRFVKQ